MKKECLDILVCPMCKGPLKLRVEKEEKEKVITGSLYCAKCLHTYPIRDSIPYLLSPDL